MRFLHTTTTEFKKLLLLPIIMAFLLVNEAYAQLLVKDIYPTGSSAPVNFVEMNGVIYFEASDDTHGQELWRSDGTDAGTYIVKDIRVGTIGGAIDQLTVMNGRLYFEANDGTNGSELWISDGTTSGTTMIDINPEGSSSPDELKVMDGVLYFAAAKTTGGVTTGKELWKSDGTISGTTMIKDIRIGTNSSSPRYLTVYNNEIYFQANDGTYGTEVWKSDGTNSGTQLLADINTSGNSAPNYFCVANGLLFFSADDGTTNGKELWYTDGTNTTLININTNADGNSNPLELYAFNGKVFFSASDGGTAKLFTSDGTTTQAHGSNITYPSDFFEWNGVLYFNARGELYTSDGTTATILKNINAVGSGYSYPNGFTSYRNRLFFIADDGINGDEVWVTDGSEDGTKLAMDIYDGATTSGVSELITANNFLFFNANDGLNGNELRFIGDCDPSRTPLLKEAGTHYSLFEKTDGSGWTHYCDCANNILLSIEKGTTGVVIPTDSVSIEIEATTATFHFPDCADSSGDCFISNENGGVVFNRSWDVKPSIQPSGDIPVRFYFSDEEFSAVKSVMWDMYSDSITDPSQMSFFKVTNQALGQHPEVQDIKQGDAVVLVHDGASPGVPSTTTWVKSDFGSDFYADFKVSSFSGGGGGASFGGSALPVEMLYFWARPATPENEVRLEWATASEVNNYGFFIERSFDLENWQMIGFVEANEGVASPAVYKFIDPAPHSGNNYYRLRQRDYDGTEDLSEIAHVSMDLFIVGGVFPNPVTVNAQVMIDVTTPVSGDATVEVYDLSRQLVKQNLHNLQQGPQLVPLDLSGLPSGMYIIKMESRGVVVNTKILIQE